MENKQDWENSRLSDYLKYGFWQPYNAWCLLAGFDYKKVQKKLKDDLDLRCSLDPESFKIEGTLAFEIESLGASDDHLRRISASAARDLNAMRANVSRLRDFWISDQLEDEHCSPDYFIEWALSKGFTPDWLDWASENRLYVAGGNVSSDVFDEADPCYPPELDIALKAWRAVSASYKGSGSAKPKALILKWLKSNYPKLPNQAYERISIVANWHKTGGAPRTD